MAMAAVLAAMYMILAYISVGTNDFKASFESLAVLAAGILLGPSEGVCVGIVGEFVHQILLYGIDPTTPLWLLPYAFEGLASGLLGRVFLKKAGESGDPSRPRFLAVICISEILLLVLVTPVNYVSAVIQGWGSWETIALGIPLRIAIMVLRIAVYTAVLPVLYRNIKKGILHDRT